MSRKTAGLRFHLKTPHARALLLLLVFNTAAEKNRRKEDEKNAFFLFAGPFLFVFSGLTSGSIGVGVICITTAALSTLDFSPPLFLLFSSTLFKWCLHIVRDAEKEMVNIFFASSHHHRSSNSSNRWSNLSPSSFFGRLIVSLQSKLPTNVRLLWERCKCQDNCIRVWNFRFHSFNNIHQ